MDSSAKRQKPSPPPSPGKRKKKPHSVELNWKPSTSKGIAGYYVYRAEGGTMGNYLRITPKPIRKTKFKDSTVKAGKIYAYAVSAVQKIGKGRALIESERTPAVSVQIPEP